MDFRRIQWNWVDGIAVQGTGPDAMDENNDLVKVKVAGSNPVVRSKEKSSSEGMSRDDWLIVGLSFVLPSARVRGSECAVWKTPGLVTVSIPGCRMRVTAIVSGWRSGMARRCRSRLISGEGTVERGNFEKAQALGAAKVSLLQLSISTSSVLSRN
jgi:hypothetical protein